MTSRLQRLMAVLISSAALIGGACSTGGDDRLRFSVKELNLDLVFSDAELAVPVEPEVIVRILPAPPEARQPDVDFSQFEERRPVPRRRPLLSCPAAPDGAIPKDRVGYRIEDPPSTGTWNRLNDGTIHIQGGPLNLTFPFPPLSRWVIPAIEEVTTDSVTGSTTNIEWEVRKEWFSGFTQIDRFRWIPGTELQLIRRETITEGAHQIFEPTPVIDFYRFETEGTSWQQAAVDMENSTAMVFEATIEARELVDVCGELIDTIRFSTSEQIVNLETGEVSGTPEGQRNVYHIANHLGGLIVKEDVHVRQSSREPKSGVPLVIELDYVSTMMSVEPGPVPEEKKKR